jgi:site-specific recombinase XerD
VLKHARASNLIAGGATVPEVAQSLGHASWKSTMRYVGVSDAQAAKAAQRATMAVF